MKQVFTKMAVAIAASAALVLAAAPAVAFSFFGSGSGSGKEQDPTKVAAEAEAFSRAQAQWAQPLMRALYRDGEWGAVLNLNRLGLAAMSRGDLALARRAFDAAIPRVESIYANDASAAKARSVFNGEKVKDFKGEPYERAMMYYYRGLLYAHDGDYQNARAAFLAADRHDTLSSTEEKAYAGTFGMMKYLAGWASACDGDRVRAEQLQQEARSVDAKVQALALGWPRALILVDSGPAPVKWGDGRHRELLKFKAGVGDDSMPVLRTAQGADVKEWQVVGDVTHQAMTRGGREVDGIMAGKARFKDGAGAVGDSALAVSSELLNHASVTGDRGAANFGLAGMLLGFVAKGVESASTPEADIRAWDNLPARVLMHAASDAAAPTAKLVLPEGVVPLPLASSVGGCSLGWGPAQPSAAELNLAAPAASVESGRGDRNRSFRGMLVADFNPAR